MCNQLRNQPTDQPTRTTHQPSFSHGGDQGRGGGWKAVQTRRFLTLTQHMHRTTTATAARTTYNFIRHLSSNLRQVFNDCNVAGVKVSGLL